MGKGTGKSEGSGGRVQGSGTASEESGIFSGAVAVSCSPVPFTVSLTA
jgi:hypothetical protein